MRYVRLKVDNAGESHFELAALDLNEADYRPPAPLLFVSHTYRADGLQFVRLPAGWTGESIHPPKHQFLICLKGHLEVTASDGEKRTFGPGDSVLMEDVSGKGHRTLVKGANECLAAIIPVDADK
jgi:quercetin dioxygenase-like cupin family protein